MPPLHTVLVVDDNRSLRPLLRRVLEIAGYRVLEAATGHEAVHRVETDGGPIDLLVTDVRLPGIGGIELSELLAERCPGIRILFVSGVADAFTGELALSGPGRAFLAKPFTAEGLLATVKDLMHA